MKKIIYFLIVMVLLTSCSTSKSDIESEKIIETIVTTEPIVKTELIVEEPKKQEAFVITEEKYDQTFEDVESFIKELNAIISSKDFETWKSKLSNSYLDKYENQELLNKLSDNPILKDYGIELKELKDYFNFVVVPSRSNVSIDEIQFISEDKIKALTSTNNQKFVVYRLIKTESGWIITD